MRTRPPNGDRGFGPARRLGALGGAILVCGIVAGCAADPAQPSPGLVRIAEGRSLSGECRGSGSPTVVLISGSRNAGDVWSATRVTPTDAPTASPDAVLPRAAALTTTCVYDRPGTTRLDGSTAPSTLVRQPTTAQEGASDLHAWLAAMAAPPPYVLVAHSWGGMIAVAFAGAYTSDVAGLVLIDPGSAELADALTPQQWQAFVDVTHRVADGSGAEAPDYEHSLATVRAAAVPAGIPVVVLTSDQPFDFGAGPDAWPAWVAAQRALADRLGGSQVTDTGSGHLIPLDRADLVNGTVNEMLSRIRGESPSPGSAP